MLRFKSRGVLVFVAALSATPVFAQEANFQSLTFSGTPSTLTGQTGGNYSLSAIANRDRNNNPCLGFGAPTPDHILTLDKDYPKLRIQVESGGGDTTLVIKGPNNVVLCGDDTGSSKEASIEVTDLKAGKYRVWVGSVTAGQKRNYSLSVQ